MTLELIIILSATVYSFTGIWFFFYFTGTFIVGEKAPNYWPSFCAMLLTFGPLIFLVLGQAVGAG